MKTRHATELTCTKCGRTLPADEFRLRSRVNERGYRYTYREQPCKSCRNDYEKKRVAATKEPVLACCSLCGEYFDAKRRGTKYCSRECAKEASRIRRIAPKQLSLPIKACTKCGSYGEKYSGRSWCKECEKESSRSRRAKLAESDPDWKKSELQRLAEYRKKNGRITTSKDRPYRKGDTLKEWEWEIILDTWRNRCAYCRTTGTLERDHVVPWSKGGLLRKENIIPACPSCNNSRGNKEIYEFCPDKALFIESMIFKQLAAIAMAKH